MVQNTSVLPLSRPSARTLSTILPMRVSFSTRESAYLLLDNDLWMKSGCGMFGWCTFMKLMLMKNGVLDLAARSR